MTQDVKNDIKKAIQVNTIPLVAIMTAVTTVLTMFVKIPTPTRGYLNLSDTMIFFSSYAFGPWVGGIIGGLGPALSDLISGYPQWAIFTFIIDGLQAVLVGLLVREFEPANVVIGSLVADPLARAGLKITDIDMENKKVSLSIRALLEEPLAEEDAPAEE